MKKLTLVFSLAVLCLAQSGRKSGIDPSMFDPECKPCEDFWRYATGGWADSHPIPADRARWGTFDQLRDANQERLKTILDAAAADTRATGDVKRLADFYSGCMNLEGLEAAGVKPLESRMTAIAAISNREQLAAYLVTLENDGTGTQAIGAMSDPDDTNRMISSVGLGGLSLPERDYYFRDDARSKEIREEFLKHVAQQMRNAGDSAEGASTAAATVLAFETALAEATPAQVVLRDPYQRIHKMGLTELEGLLPEYPWKEAFASLGVDSSVTINVTWPDFLRAVSTRMREEPLENWKTWLRWRTVSASAPYLSKAFFDENFRFDQTVLSGVAQQLPRWKTCVSSADATFGDVLGKLYVEKYFPAQAQQQMSELIENLRGAFGETLATADWLEEDTRKSAVRKLASFDPRIGFPVKWRDYSAVTVTRDGYLASKLSAVKESRLFNVARVGKDTDRTRWTMTAPTVNANYMPALNAITFPAGILQFPFFEMDADPAVNYGAIGAVIGHEMGHGFDDQGSKFDAEGNLKDWWTAADRTKFDQRASCVTNQFDSIDLGDGMRHQGKLVTGEAMGDLGGLTIAYKAYHRSLQGKEAPVIDGLTGDQRFFLAFARVWGGSQRTEAARRQLATDPHPLAKWRTNATLQNMPEFHAAFACKRGDPMVRAVEQQCRLW